MAIETATSNTEHERSEATAVQGGEGFESSRALHRAAPDDETARTRGLSPRARAGLGKIPNPMAGTEYFGLASENAHRGELLSACSVALIP